MIAEIYFLKLFTIILNMNNLIYKLSLHQSVFSQ